MYYYKILNKFSKKYPLYAGDFRLVDREIIRNFNLNNEETIITRCISLDYSKMNLVYRIVGYQENMDTVSIHLLNH